MFSQDYPSYNTSYNGELFGGMHMLTWTIHAGSLKKLTWIG